MKGVASPRRHPQSPKSLAFTNPGGSGGAFDGRVFVQNAAARGKINFDETSQPGSTPFPWPSSIPHTGRHVRLEVLNAAKHGRQLYQVSIEGSQEEREDRFRYLYEEIPTEAAFQLWVEQAEKSATYLHFAIIDVKTSSVQGRLALMRIKPQHGVLEVGCIMFGKALQRTTGATEAIFMMARYVFETLRYKRLEWKCDAQNGPSRRAATRLGFKFEGIFRKHMVVKGQNRDTAWYSMVDDEWGSPGQEGSSGVVGEALKNWLSSSNFDGHQRQVKKLEDVRQAILRKKNEASNVSLRRQQLVWGPSPAQISDEDIRQVDSLLRSSQLLVTGTNTIVFLSAEESKELIEASGNTEMCLCILRDIASAGNPFDSFAGLMAAVSSAFRESFTERQELFTDFAKAGRYFCLLQQGVRITQEDISRLYIEGVGAATRAGLDEILQMVKDEDAEFKAVFSGVQDILGLIVKHGDEEDTEEHKFAERQDSGDLPPDVVQELNGLQGVKWYFKDINGDQHGPCTQEELVPFFENNLINEDSMWFKHGDESKRQLSRSDSVSITVGVGINGDEGDEKRAGFSQEISVEEDEEGLEPVVRDWVVMDETGAPRGPLSEEVVKQCLDQGILTLESLCFTDGQEEWLPLRKTELAYTILASPQPLQRMKSSSSMTSLKLGTPVKKKSSF